MKRYPNDWLEDAIKRHEDSKQDDSWQSIVIQALCGIALFGAIIAVSLGWVPHG